MKKIITPQATWDAMNQISPNKMTKERYDELRTINKTKKPSKKNVKPESNK